MVLTGGGGYEAAILVTCGSEGESDCQGSELRNELTVERRSVAQERFDMVESSLGGFVCRLVAGSVDDCVAWAKVKIGAVQRCVTLGKAATST